MDTIQKIHTGLQNHWDTLRSKFWKCTAQKRFGVLWFAPMQTEIDSLNTTADTLQELCERSATLAASVREPDDIE